MNELPESVARNHFSQNFHTDSLHSPPIDKTHLTPIPISCHADPHHADRHATDISGDGRMVHRCLQGARADPLRPGPRAPPGHGPGGPTRVSPPPHRMTETPGGSRPARPTPRMGACPRRGRCPVPRTAPSPPSPSPAACRRRGQGPRAGHGRPGPPPNRPDLTGTP